MAKTPSRPLEPDGKTIYSSRGFPRAPAGTPTQPEMTAESEGAR